MGDAFRALCFGVNFDKKKFGNDIALFEKSKKNTSNTGNKREGNAKRELEDNTEENESKRLKPEPLDATLDYVEMSDDESNKDEEEIGHDPFAADDDDADENAEVQEDDEDALEYDLNSTEKYQREEGDSDKEGDEQLKYFASSGDGGDEAEEISEYQQALNLEKWEMEEAVRTGVSVEQAKELRDEMRITVTGEEVPFPLLSIDGLESTYSINKTLLDNMTKCGYTSLTPIQLQAIPTLMCERESVVCAPTGSGKTLCYALPILHLLHQPQEGGIRALILSPTRELTEQIYRHFKRLSAGIPFRYCLLTKSAAKKKTIMKNIYDILITTPKRLEHLIKEKQVDLTKVKYLIFDEADKLFDETFLEQVDAIVTACKNPKVKLSLLSATISPVVDELAKSVLKFPVDIHIGARNSAASTIEQQLIHVNEAGKLMVLRQLIKKGLPAPVIIFVKEKSRAKYLYEELSSDQLRVAATHSDLSPNERSEVVKNFRAGNIWFLIATDLMARGMDFKNVGCVVNYDCPTLRSSYIHRIGRTGRAGQPGKAITLYSENDMAMLRTIAGVVRESGCEVPSWMGSLTKKSEKEAKKHFYMKNNQKKYKNKGRKGGKKHNANKSNGNSKPSQPSPAQNNSKSNQQKGGKQSQGGNTPPNGKKPTNSPKPASNATSPAGKPQRKKQVGPRLKFK